jgi:hypothetical protein
MRSRVLCRDPTKIPSRRLFNFHGSLETWWFKYMTVIKMVVVLVKMERTIETIVWVGSVAWIQMEDLEIVDQKFLLLSH